MIKHPRSDTFLTLLQREGKQMEGIFDMLQGWDLDLLEKHEEEETSRTTVLFDILDDEYTLESQLWLFRYDCIVNYKHPWICLDTSQALLGLCRFTTSTEYSILEPSLLGNDNYVLVCPKNQSYVSNKLCPKKSGKLMNVICGSYYDLTWQLEIWQPESVTNQEDLNED